MSHQSKKIKKTLNLIPKGKKLNILDIGCGFGNEAAMLAARGHKVKGIDIGEEEIKLAKKKYKNVFFERKEVLKENFSKYDLVIGFGIVEYLDISKFFKKAEKEMKENSTLIFVVPNVCSLSKRFRCLVGINPNRELNPHHTFTFNRMRKIISNLKFKKKEIYSLGFDSIKRKAVFAPGNLSGNIIVKLTK